VTAAALTAPGIPAPIHTTLGPSPNIIKQYDLISSLPIRGAVKLGGDGVNRVPFTGAFAFGGGGGRGIASVSARRGKRTHTHGVVLIALHVHQAAWTAQRETAQRKHTAATQCVTQCGIV
jgi:hypothetical protein